MSPGATMGPSSYMEASSDAYVAVPRLPSGPDTGVGVGNERREHHARDQEERHAQQHQVDDGAHLVEGDGALTTQGGDRPKKKG